MRLFALLGLLTVLVVPTYAQDNSSGDAPYLYYYSNVLKGIVIERADGTDSRILGHNLVDESNVYTKGPGWSADGTWFAWHVELPKAHFSVASKGYAVHIDGDRNLDMLQDFSCVHSMYWHPLQNILLVHGAVIRSDNCSQTSYPVATYWLIDADERRLMATYSVNRSSDYGDHPIIYWQEDVILFSVLAEGYVNDRYSLLSYLVSMHFDGTVNMDPKSPAELDVLFADLTPDLSAIPPEQIRIDFRHWWEQPEERIESVPFNTNFNGPPVASLPHAVQSEWVLIGHETCRAGGCAGFPGVATVYNTETGLHRELTDCTARPSCIGWIPEYLDTSILSPGYLTSVLPSPVSVEYDEEPLYSGFLDNIRTHEVTCNTENWRREQVRNINTQAVDFILPVSESCNQLSETQIPEPIVFALSADERYFAVTDGSQYTSLYDATTGERITTLYFYGELLAFSGDDRYLITEGRTATATWDIQELIINHAD